MIVRVSGRRAGNSGALARLRPRTIIMSWFCAFPSPPEFAEQFSAVTEADKSLLNYVSRVAPAAVAFDFLTSEECRSNPRSTVLGWLEALGGSSFHVRMLEEVSSQSLRRQASSSFPAMPFYLAAKSEAAQAGLNSVIPTMSLTSRRLATAPVLPCGPRRPSALSVSSS